MDATQNAADWFAGLGGASQNGGGNWFSAGTYLCEVIAITRKVGANTDNKGHKIIVGELRIVEVLAKLPADGEYAASKHAGEVCSVVCDLNSKYPYMDLGRLKGLLTAAAGAPDDTSDAGWMQYAAAATEPPGTTLAGARIIAQVGKARTKANKAITPVTFAAVPVVAGS